MKEIYRYLDERNSARRWFDLPKLSLDRPQDLRILAELVEGDLSPENLTCDGELPRAVVIERRTYLIAVAKQIKQRDPSIQFWELDHG